MARKQAIYIPPVLKIGKDGSWYVEFSIRDPRTGKKYRQRDGKDFMNCKTKAEKEDLAANKIKYWRKKIEKENWRPWLDQAKIYEDQLEYHEVARKYGRQRKNNNTLRIVINKYLEDIKPRLRTKSYISYKSKLRQFCQYIEHDLKDVDITAITADHLKEFYHYLATEEELAILTIQKYGQHICAFFKFALQGKFIEESPYLPPHKKLGKEVDFSARPFEKEDIRLLLETFKEYDPQLYLASLFQYYTAIRPGNELHNLKVGDINFHNSTIKIPKTTGKMRARTIDLPRQFAEIIKEMKVHNFPHNYYVIGRNRMPGLEKIGTNTLGNRFNAFRKQFDMSPDYKFYSFKHTGAGNLLMHGASMIEVMNFLGHTDFKSTYRYVCKHFGFRNERVIENFPDP